MGDLTAWDELVGLMRDFVAESSEPLPPDDAELDESGAPKWEDEDDADD